MINSLIFPAPSPPSYTVSQIPVTHVPVHIPWRFQAATAVSAFTFGVLIHCPGSPFLVVYGHPNAVDVGLMIDEMEFFARKSGCSVLLWEYQGYGVLQDDDAVIGSRSDAVEPGEEALREDILAVYKYCLDELGVASSQIVLMGRSIGTGPSTWLAARAESALNVPPPLLLFLQAPFLSIVECCRTVARAKLGGALESLASMVVADRFSNVDEIQSVRCPVIIQHGDRDEIVTYDHAQRLVEAAKAGGKLDVVLHTAVGYGHNDLSVSEAARILSAALRQKLVGRWLPHELKLHVPEYHRACASFAAALQIVQESDPQLATLPPTTRRMQAAFVSMFPAVRDVYNSRASLAPLLLVNVCEFISRFARLWQQNNVVRRKQEQQLRFAGGSGVVGTGISRVRSWWKGSDDGASTSASQAQAAPTVLSPPTSVKEALEEFIAIHGSPFGIYLMEHVGEVVHSSAQNNNINELVPESEFSYQVFGLDVDVRSGSHWLQSNQSSRFAGCASSSSGNRRRRVVKTVTELHWPPALIRDVTAMVQLAAAQQDLLTDTNNSGVRLADDSKMFLSGAQIDRLQLQVERFIGFLPDQDWAELQHQLRGLTLPTPSSTTKINSSLLTSGAAYMLALPEVSERFHQLTASHASSAAGSSSDSFGAPTAADYDYLLCCLKNRASRDGLIHQRRSDAVEMVFTDPSWSLAREIHRHFVLCMRHISDATAVEQSARSIAKNKKSDEDCCMM